MPAKMDADLNLRFLFMCFKHSNFSTIDYHKVAAYFQIKAPAARMRLMRLKNSLENDMNVNPQRDIVNKKRPRPNPWNAAPKCGKGFPEEDDDDEAMDDMPLMQRWGGIKSEGGGVLVKNEDGSVWVKKEDGLVKKESAGDWVKKEEEEEVDEQNDVQMVKSEPQHEDTNPFSKQEHEDLRFDSPMKMEVDVKSEVNNQQNTPYSISSTSEPQSSTLAQFRPLQTSAMPQTPTRIPGLQTPMSTFQTPAPVRPFSFDAPVRHRSIQMTSVVDSAADEPDVGIKSERAGSVSSPESIVTSYAGTPCHKVEEDDGRTSPAVLGMTRLKVEPEY